MGHRIVGYLVGVSIVSALLVIYALRRGELPLDRVSRSAKPVRFWAEVALCAVLGLGSLGWAAVHLIQRSN
jgi:heme A synthase